MDRLTAGIDVGGPAKGFHAVALSGTVLVDKFRSRESTGVAVWCVRQGALGGPVGGDDATGGGLGGLDDFARVQVRQRGGGRAG